jgi:Tol biopolymer transport system component
MKRRSRWSLIGTVCLSLALSACFSGSVEHGNVAFDLSGDGRSMVFCAADGDLYLLDLAGGKITRLTETPADESAPVFSPDGKSVAYSAPTPEGKSHAIYLMSLADKSVRRVTTDTKFSDYQPAFSPDGKRLAIIRAQRLQDRGNGSGVWRDKDVYLINVDDGAAQALTKENFFILRRPRFHPDGSKVIFTGNQPYSSAQFKEDAGGMLDTLIEVSVNPPYQMAGLFHRPPDGLPIHALGTAASISRDGSQITFISDRAEAFQYDVYTMKLGSTDAKAVNAIRFSTYNDNPTFASDGKSIYFLAGVEKNAGSRAIYSLWKVDADGKNAQEVAGSGLFTAPLKWKPKKN